MDAERRPRSLRQRIDAAAGVHTVTIDTAYYADHSSRSFAERYRGTEFETPVVVLRRDEPLYTRGRAFVFLMAGVLVGAASLLLVTSG